MVAKKTSVSAIVRKADASAAAVSETATVVAMVTVIVDHAETVADTEAVEAVSVAVATVTLSEAVTVAAAVATVADSARKDSNCHNLSPDSAYKQIYKDEV